MQQNKEQQAADAYLSWQDLLDEETTGGAAPAYAAGSGAAMPPAAGEGLGGERGAAAVELPPDVRALLVEKERLEGDLAHLTGHGRPRPEDERMRRMYPVRVHTKDTRIEERRLGRHDEQQRMRKQRVLAGKVTRLREQQQQEESAAQRKRRTLEAARGSQRGEERRQEQEEVRRRRAVARIEAALRAEAWAAAARADRERKKREQELVTARWARDRQAALAGNAHRRQAAADLEPPATRESPAERRRLPPDAGQAPMTGAGAAGGRAALPPGEETGSRLAQRKREAAAWEEERDRQRNLALARRKADRQLAARLDGRSTKGNDEWPTKTRS